MLELFSRIPDALTLQDDAHLSPIPVDGKASSLSAILLDEAYYSFIHESKSESGGVSLVPPECIIPLKAKAWLDLTGRREAGEQVDEKDIKKHKNDVFRLFQVIAPDTLMVLPDSVGDDLQRFLEAVEADPPQSLKTFGLVGITANEVIDTLRAIYKLSR